MAPAGGLMLLVLAVMGCRRESPRPSGEGAIGGAAAQAEPSASTNRKSPSEGSIAARADALEALPGPAEQALTVPGYQPASVVVPVGAKQPRPVLIALHGNFDRPEWQCEVWRGIVGSRCFVLCPRGIRRADVKASLDRYTYGAAKSVELEVAAVLGSARAHFSGHIDLAHPVLVGFSLGAIHGARLLTQGKLDVSRAVLVEGGYKDWSRKRLATFAARGGRRLLFGCGQSVCRQIGHKLAGWAAESPLSVRVADGGDAGHTYAGDVAAALARDFEWLVEGDPRFDTAAGP